MKFLVAAIGVVFLYLVGIAGTTLVLFIWLNLIGGFGLEFRELLGIAGVVMLINTTVTTSRS